MRDQGKSSGRALVFDDYPRCALCGQDDAVELLVTGKSRLVRCRRCGLVYTSPRANEAQWNAYLRNFDTPRNIIVTENRLAYGVALDHNVAAQPENWRDKIARKNARVLAELRAGMRIPLTSLHDIGCGVGFLVADAVAAGIAASGNDLNGYAIKVMRERLGFDVFFGSIAEIGLADNSRDAVTMTDFIEHTYHPRRDIAEAFRILRPGGALYVGTFRIDSPAFAEKGPSWNMLSWNHVYHFSSETLPRLIADCGFTIGKVLTPGSAIVVIGTKPDT